MQWWVFSPEEQHALDELSKKLPRLPLPGWDKEQILDEMGCKGHPLAEREENWHKICGVIVKSRRIAEQRQPDMPIIRYCGIGVTLGYHLVGFTGHGGRFLLFQIPLPEQHRRAG